MKTRIGVLFGGRSGEHEVSLCSAASVCEHLSGTEYEVIAIGIDRDGRWYPQQPAEIIQTPGFGRVFRLKKEGEWFINHFPIDNKLVLRETQSGETVEVDCVFPVVHGTFCEDGTLQGLLDCVGVPYVGAGTMASAVGMDKDVTKRLLEQAGIPVVPWVTVTSEQWNEQRAAVISSIKAQIGLPCFAKPANAGSSVGISKIKRDEDIIACVDEAFAYDNKILVEQAVDCREIECAVLGNESPEVSVAGEIIPNHEFYSYDAKYMDADGAKLCIPANINQKQMDLVREMAAMAYRTLCLSGLTRIDFFLDKHSGSFFLNEVNTLPGFTSISMYPMLWQHDGLGYKELLQRLIGLAFERAESRRRIKTEK